MIILKQIHTSNMTPTQLLYLIHRLRKLSKEIPLSDRRYGGYIKGMEDVRDALKERMVN